MMVMLLLMMMTMTVMLIVSDDHDGHAAAADGAAAVAADAQTGRRSVRRPGGHARGEVGGSRALRPPHAIYSHQGAILMFGWVCF